METKFHEPPSNGDDGVIFVAYFTHWRTGKVYFAKDYGLKGFPIGRRKK